MFLRPIATACERKIDSVFFIAFVPTCDKQFRAKLNMFPDVRRVLDLDTRTICLLIAIEHLIAILEHVKLDRCQSGGIQVNQILKSIVVVGLLGIVGVTFQNKLDGVSQEALQRIRSRHQPFADISIGGYWSNWWHVQNILLHLRIPVAQSNCRFKSTRHCRE